MNVQRGKLQQGKWGIQLLELAIDEAHGTRVSPFESITQTQFLDKFDDGGIGTKKVMIEFLQPGITNTKTGCQAPCRGFLFKDHDRVTGFSQAICNP
jgi:hypothetical protein